MRIFISGAINSDPYYLVKFNKAEEHIFKLGHTPIVPIDLPEGLTDAEYFMIDHYLIGICDGIYMLPDWTNSTGATIEHEIAVRDKKKIFYAGNENSERELRETGIPID